MALRDSNQSGRKVPPNMIGVRPAAASLTVEAYSGPWVVVGMCDQVRWFKLLMECGVGTIEDTPREAVPELRKRMLTCPAQHCELPNGFF